MTCGPTGGCLPPLWHNDLEYFYSSVEGMPPVHCTDISSIKFTGTHIYTGVERGAKRMKGLGQEHNDPLQHLCWTAGSQVIALWLLFHTTNIHPISSHRRWLEELPISMNWILVHWFVPEKIYTWNDFVIFQENIPLTPWKGYLVLTHHFSRTFASCQLI